MNEKKLIGDFHVHSTGSDGKLSPEEIAKLAIDKGLPYICFTDHYPFPPEFNSRFKDKDLWANFHNEEYCKQVLELKKRFTGKIEIYFGAEFNWLEDYEDWTKKEVKKKPYDYALIAVHMVPQRKRSNNPINWTEESFRRIITNYDGIQKAVKEYYKQVRLAAQSDLFDCIAHLDLIKVWNKDSKYFSEESQWYQKEVCETLDSIASSGMCVEINTSNYGPYYPVKEQCPSSWILKEARKRNIPITIGSDAHEGKELGMGLEKARGLAKQAGYDSITIFKNRKPIQIAI